MSLSRLAIAATVLLSALLATASRAQDFFDRSVLRTIELTFIETDWEDILAANKAAGLQVYLAGDMVVDGVLYPSVGVRYKGNSSYWISSVGEKKPLNIDLKAFGVDQKVMGNSKLVLNNQWADQSLMREVIAYQVLNQYIPSSRANFVKVVVNGENYGIYTNVEHLGGDFIERWYGEGDGFRYKAVPPDTWPDTMTTPPPPGDLALQDISSNMIRAERAYELKNRELDVDHHLGLLAAIDVLNNAQSDLLLDELNPLMDTDNAIWHLALNNAICTLDAYYNSGRNYYLYHDPVHDRISILPWDNNMAFGNYGNAPTSLSPVAGKGDTNRPLMSKLVKGSALRQEYLAHMRSIVDHALDPAVLNAEITALQALIDAEVQIDTHLTIGHATWLNGVNTLKNFITNRHAFLDTHSLVDVERPEYLAGGHRPAKPNAGDPVHFQATVENLVDPIKSVFAHYRVAGAFQEIELFDDGMHGDGAAADGVYGNDVPAFAIGDKVQYYFYGECVNSNAGNFMPEAASFAPFSFIVRPDAGASDVLLNEFVARNNSGPMDEAGEFEDWIELYNHGAAAVDLSGMWLTDDLTVPMKWAIPAGTMLDADSTLLIWADNEPLDGPMHATFKLSFGGEDLALYAPDGVTMLDFQTFGIQESDVATARLHDADPLWVTLPGTTPDASNNLSCGVRDYNALDAARNVASLEIIGTPSPGATVQVALSGFGAGQTVQLLIGGGAIVFDHPPSGLSLLVKDDIQQIVVTADAAGAASLDLPIPPNPSLVGMSFYLQAGATKPSAAASHGIEAVICP